jgi:uncharacterized protein YdiU (UPF0061 family)
MNTDNMSILGLTMDYGPYGWLEDYDPTWTPNTTDSAGHRYCYGRQAQIAHWNLMQLANAIYPLVGEAPPLEQALRDFTDLFERRWEEMMAAKLGLVAFQPALDRELIRERLRLLPEVETDMTLFFRHLPLLAANSSGAALSPEEKIAPLLPAYYRPEQLTPAYRNHLLAWLNQYHERLRQDNLPEEVRRQRMNAVNPKYVLRNYLAQLVIDQIELGDVSLVDEMLEVLRHPYDEQPGKERFAEKRPEWARHRPGCSMLSCSS